MNNKLFKTAVVLVTIVGMLCSFASAATINSLTCTETRDRISMNVTFAEDATRGAYIAYAAKSVEAGTEGAEEIDNNYYVLGPIVAIFQPEGSFLTLGNHGEPINPALIPEGYDYIVLKAGDNGAASTLADAEAVAIPEPVTKYTITFVNYDGTTLYEVEVEDGVTPEYVGETPVREADGENTYAFSGWTPAIVAATGNATYTAEFEATPIVPEVPAVKVTFANGAETVEVEAKDGVVIAPAAPTAPTPGADAIIDRYEFVGWTDEVTTYVAGAEVPATEDVTLYAKYRMYDKTNTDKVMKWGDYTGDGKVLVNDMTQIINYFKNKSSCTRASLVKTKLDSGRVDYVFGDIVISGTVIVNDMTQMINNFKNKANCTATNINTEIYYINK